RAEHHDANLRVLVLQAEVHVPRVMCLEIRDLTFHPGVAVLAFNVGAQRGHQIAHRPDAAIGRLETESELVSRTHKQPVWVGHSCPTLSTLTPLPNAGTAQSNKAPPKAQHSPEARSPAENKTCCSSRD